MLDPNNSCGLELLHSCLYGIYTSCVKFTASYNNWKVLEFTDLCSKSHYTNPNPDPDHDGNPIERGLREKSASPCKRGWIRQEIAENQRRASITPG